MAERGTHAGRTLEGKVMHNQRIRFAWWAGAAMASGLIAGGVGGSAARRPPGPPQVYQRRGCSTAGFTTPRRHYRTR